MKVFSFYEYDFPNSLESLIDYLGEKKINYVRRSIFIKFQISNENCVQPIDVKAYYKGDLIYRMTLFCYTKDYGMNKVLDLFDKTFELTTKDLNKCERIYSAKDFEIAIKTGTYLSVDVRYEVLSPKLSKIEDRYKMKKIAIWTILGVILSIFLIILYLSFYNVLWLHIVTGITAISFALLQIYTIYLRDACLSKKAKKALMIISPVVFVIIVIFCFFIVMGKVASDEIGNISSFAWQDAMMMIIYLFPSFHLVILVLSALSYA